MITDPPLDRVAEDDDTPFATPGKMRADAMKRLQIGISGLVAMLLLVALANIIRDRATVTDLGTVPEAMPTVAPQATPVPNKDPLADAGVQPELPPATAAPTPAPAVTMGQGVDDDPPAQP